MQRRIRTTKHAILALALSAAPLAAAAQTATSWYEQPGLTGDWGGLRPRLADDGIKFHVDYTGQFGGVVSGGRAQGSDYAQQIFAGTDLDLQKLFGWRGASFHFNVSDRAGRNISSDYVGSKFSNFGVYGAAENFRLMNASYEQNWFGGRLNTLVGYYSLGNEFANTPDLCDFSSNAFCAHAQFFPNGSGWLDAPTGAWGGRVKLFIDPSLYVEGGVFESNPLLAARSNYGWHLGLQGATGTVSVFEAGQTVSLGPQHLTGHYKIGGYYDSSEVADVEHSTLERRGRYGGYILGDQMVYKLDQSGSRNVRLFGQAMLGDKRTAVIDSWFTAAVLIKGPLAARPDDILALGWVKANVNPRALTKQYLTLQKEGDDDAALFPAEQLLEAGYIIQVLPWLHFMPDVQYDINPGAFTYKTYSNAWVVSGQLKVSL